MKLDLDLISRATNGDSQAIQVILQYYGDYIDALSAFVLSITFTVGGCIM